MEYEELEETNVVTEQTNSVAMFPWRGAYRAVRRAVVKIFSVLGPVANLLGIYAFGESHGWWELRIAVSEELEKSLLMAAVGIGGPWAMVVGGIGAAKLAELFTRNRAATLSVVRAVVTVGCWVAILHSAEMAAGFTIFPRFLSAEGFFKVVGYYFLTGLALGGLYPLIIHGLHRNLPHDRKGRPTKPLHRSAGSAGRR